MTSQAEQDFDETLKGIAKELHLTTEIDDLGKALGCTTAEIGRCHDANEKQGGNYMGTLNMLRTWSKKQTAATELQALRAALIKAQLNRLASKYCANSAEGRQHTSSSASSASTDARDTQMGRIATTKELKKLASLLYASFYTDLAVNLGLEPAEFDNIQRENPTLTDANFRMLLKWKAKENSGLVVDLDRALVESGCGALAKEYKQN